MFRRRQGAVEPEDTTEAEPFDPTAGPYDIDQVDLEDGTERLDLGGLVLPPMPDHEVQLQVDEATNTVQAVLVASEQGAVELRPFAAPRHGDLWSEVRPEIAADMKAHGGQVEERDGTFGTELVGLVPIQLEDGTQAVQPSRIAGINGSRWLLRATFLGQPAVDEDAFATWDTLLGAVIVRRGSEAMPVGDPLPLRLPPGAQRQD